MEKEIAEGSIGSIAQYDVEFKGGKFVAKLDAKPVEGVFAGVHVEVDADKVIDALAAAAEKAIPGQVDDAIFELMKVGLKSALHA